MKKTLTTMQKEILATFINEYKEKKTPPKIVEIAKKLNMSKQAVRQLIVRALRNIEYCPLCGKKYEN